MYFELSITTLQEPLPAGFDFAGVSPSKARLAVVEVKYQQPLAMQASAGSSIHCIIRCTSKKHMFSEIQAMCEKWELQLLLY